ncbi:ABC transporter permease [Roseiarcaceae bacterium H3SJ34-1]|uniref:ABC transporter permease n=1 Tax=Terripilifer ovatus TaxID=3032367 RepID=UPI003AB95DFC|nr:ABC transporter permease [Roseiarcaceae bacterium H3SJ34-1]
MPIVYVARRLLMAVPTLLGVVVFIFVLLRVVPGDPIAMMIPGEATPQDIANLRAVYGLDRSIGEQFVIYIGNLLRGDFGESISVKQNVLSLVLDRLPATFELAFVAMVMAIVIGLSFGIIAVYWRRRWPEYAVDAANAIALSLPEFIWGLILILALSVMWPLFPISGRIDPVQAADFKTQFYLFESLLTGRLSLLREVLEYMFLPAVSLALPLAAVIARVLKTSLMEGIGQDYVLLARVKGLSPLRVLLRHVLPNALVSTITITGLHFTFLVGGTVLVELIFSYPGIGNMLYGAAINRDLPLLQGVTIIFAVIFILLNLLIDISYTLVNPRVRLA